MKNKIVQYLSDKIKAARASETGEGWLTFDGKRCRIVTTLEAIDKALNAPGPSGYPGVSCSAFVRSKKGIEYKRIHRHDGGRIRYTGGSRYLNDNDVLALVIEEHERNSNDLHD